MNYHKTFQLKDGGKLAGQRAEFLAALDEPLPADVTVQVMSMANNQFAVPLPHIKSDDDEINILDE